METRLSSWGSVVALVVVVVASVGAALTGCNESEFTLASGGSGSATTSASKSAGTGTPSSTASGQTSSTSKMASSSTNVGPSATSSTGSGGFVCNNMNVIDCNMCPGLPLPCITCDTFGNTASFCAPASQQCRNFAPPSFGQSCQCSVASDCHASFQVCFNANFCHTCGEPSSDGSMCKGGGTCSAGVCN